MTTPLYLLRCVQLGLTMADLEELTMGTVYDMFTERSRDDCQWADVAEQEDFDRF